MKKVFLCFLILGGILLKSQEHHFLAIDSLYFNSISKFYKEANEYKNSIWTDMKLGPVCLFRIDGPAFLYKHPNPPGNFKKLSKDLYVGKQVDLGLFGATQQEINGMLTAIIDYGNRYSDKKECFAELFHELHHVYQRNHVEKLQFDNPVTLLTYPEDYQNDALKLFENKQLFDLLFSNGEEFTQHLNMFYTCRLKRLKIIGEKYLSYEKAVESVEGPAVYCEYKFILETMDKSSIITQNYIHRHFYGSLTEPFYGRENLRYRHLATGLILCLILDKYVENWKTEYYQSGMYLSDFFFSKLKPEVIDVPDISDLYSLSSFFTAREKQKHIDNYNKFLNQGGTKLILKFNTNPGFKGFDPMNAEAINDSLILHKTFLSLGDDKNDLFVSGREVLTEFKGQIWFVNKVIIFIDPKTININEGRITLNTSNIKMNWKGEIADRNKKQIIVTCD
jgi:hypothetical protein